MDEIMLMEYLKSKGIGHMSEREFIHKFKDFLEDHSKTSYMRYHEDPYKDHFEDILYRRGMGGMRRHQDYYDYLHSSYPEMYASNSYFTEEHSPFIRHNKSYEDAPYIKSNTFMGKTSMMQDHFDDAYARYIVSMMHHTEGGRSHSGEKFSMAKAKEVQERYRGMLSHDITVADIYVAINAQYHDYHELFKSWFGSGIEQKIIESAIIFWFKDADYSKGFKLMEYFKED